MSIFKRIYQGINRYTPTKIFACWFFIIPTGLYGFYYVKQMKDKRRGDEYLELLKTEMDDRKQYEALRNRKILNKDS